MQKNIPHQQYCIKEQQIEQEKFWKTDLLLDKKKTEILFFLR